MKNYRVQLKNLLVKTAKELKVSKPVELSKEDSERLLLVNDRAMRQFKLALKCLKAGKIDRAEGLLCDLPYYMSGIAAKGQRLTGSNGAYRRFDHIRHLIRMGSLDNGGKVGQGKIWNNVLLVG